MRLRTVAYVLAASLGTLCTVAPAHAQSDGDRATARALGQEGQQALENKDFKTAEDRFRRADNLVHAPTLMLGLARALAAEGKYVESQEAYNRIVREGLPPGAPDVFKRAFESAKKEVDDVAPKVGGVTITVKTSSGADVPDPKVVLDEHPMNSASLGVQRSVDPGPHVLRVTADGYKPAELRFIVGEGGSISEPVMLDKDLGAVAPPAEIAPVPVGSGAGGGASANAEPARTSSTMKVLPWVAFGVGGAGLVVGTITGIMAVSKHSSLSDRCVPNGVCKPAQQGDLDSYHTLGTVSTIGFIVGGVGAAAGVVLLLTQPRGEASHPAAQAAVAGFRIAPVVGPGSIGAAGRF